MKLPSKEAFFATSKREKATSPKDALAVQVFLAFGETFLKQGTFIRVQGQEILHYEKGTVDDGCWYKREIGLR